MVEKKNPFAEENFTSGAGGLWDGRVVTILSARTLVDFLARRDGEPVLDDNGKQAFRNVVEIKGIADDQEFERRETYSVGGMLPTADGTGLTKPDGSPFEGFHKNCEMAKFAAGISKGGFPIEKLWDASVGKIMLNALVGARFLMAGAAKHDKNGNIKKNVKGYDEQRFYPVEFKGYKAGVTAATTTTTADTSALQDKATNAVVTVLAESGGKVTRAELVRKLAAKLVGDVDGNKIVALVARSEFHKDKPWTVDGTGYSL